MRQLIERWGLREPILDLAASGAPIFGTCAGMIVLARDIAGGERADPAAARRDRRAQRVRPPARLVRGGPRRRRSSATRRSTRCSSARRSSSATGPDVDVLARLDDGRVVAVRERNVIATAFHPELAGETRFHRLVATMAAEHDEPGEGAAGGRHPTRRARGRPMTATRAAAPAGQGPRRPADRPRRPRRAVAPVPDRTTRRRARSACRSAARRSACSACSGCRSAPSAPTTCCTSTRRAAGSPASSASSASRPATSGRSSSSTRSGMADAGDIRYRLVQQLLREGAQARGGALPRRVRRRGRQRRAAHAGGLHALRRGAHPRSGPPSELPKPWTDKAASGRPHPARRAARRARPAAACTSPRRPARSPASRRSGCPTGSARAPIGACRAPALRRSCASPTSRPSCRRRPTAARTGPSSTAFLQVGVAKEDQPHYLKVVARPEADPTALIGYGLGIIEARTAKGGEPSTRSRRHRARANL